MSNKQLGGTVRLPLLVRPWELLKGIEVEERVRWMQEHRTIESTSYVLECAVELDVQLLLKAGGDVRPNGLADPPNYVKRAMERLADSIYLATGDVPTVIRDEQSTPVLLQVMEEHERKVAAKLREDREREEKRAREIAERKARKDAYEEDRRLWVLEHGSERLKQALALDLLAASDKVYREERLAREYPGWRWYSDGEEHDDPRNPTMAELQSLAQARERCPEAELVFVREPIDVEYYDGTEDPDCYMAVVARILNHTAVLPCTEKAGT